MQEQIDAAVKDRSSGLEQRVDEVVAQLRTEIQEESAECSALKTCVDERHANVEASLASLQDNLRGGAAVCEARFRETQAAVAALEERMHQSIDEVQSRALGRHDQAETRTKDQLDALRVSLAADLRDCQDSQDSKMKHFADKCRDELDFVHSAWARGIEWTAEIDKEELERDGIATLDSPSFTAAGLHSLQLQLRLSRQTEGERWVCGAFLSAPHGKVAFRLSIFSRSLVFNADFNESKEWGSTKLAILEKPPPELLLKLDILDVVAPVARPFGTGYIGDEIVASTRVVDVAQAAAREISTLRATMVRRVEWRISRVTERLAAAREAATTIGDDEALEPLCSPPFAAAGFEGLQLQLYPLGYRPRGDESCGFFLVCPRGLFVKCRAFVGDSSRTFEHQYDAREPYGRGSFCRLSDKADGDDCVVCGVEFLEVRQEQTAQVRGGPFGNVADQLKIVCNPSVGGMEVIRELRELHGSDKKGRSKQRAAAAAAMRATVPAGGMGLHESKSLPSLLPHVPVASPGGAAGLSTTLTGAPSSMARVVDAIKFR